ncbi:MAG: hypothetical protein FK734_14215 [Asgard group archaeon]|nr:hypothetical protein [Asgard group archaeon]
MKLRYFTFIFISFFVSCSCLTLVGQNTEATERTINFTVKYDTNGYIEHSPIFISGDYGFLSYGFPGDGTKNNPYVIENFNITSTGTDEGISIYDTTKYFVIRNCYIESLYTGIVLGEIMNGTATIQNNLFVNNFRAMQLFDISGLFVVNNTGLGNIIGIDLGNNYYSIIKDNYFYGKGIVPSDFSYGIIAYKVFHSQVMNNTLENYEYGIRLINSNMNYLVNNTCNLCHEASSMSLLNSHYNRIIGNSIFNNSIDDGIRLSTSSRNYLIYNHIENCSSYGIAIYANCKQNIIHHNIIINNTKVFSQGCDYGFNNIWYDKNTLEGNFWNDWIGTGNYSLEGSSNNYDYHPLVNIVPIDWKTLTIPSLPSGIDDSYEENDLSTAAKPILANNTYTLIANDDDYFHISLERYNRLEVSLSFNSSEVYFYLSLMDINGDFIAAPDDIGNLVEMAYTVLFSGDYTIELYLVETYVPSANYTLTITKINNYRPDDSYEDNDSIEEAKIIEANNGTYSLVYTDMDFFKIELTKKQKIHVEISFDNSINDLELYLVTRSGDGIGDILASSETSSPTEVIDYTAAKAGYYYIQIKSTDLDGIPLIPIEYTLTITLSIISLGLANYYLLPLIIVPLILVFLRKRK